MLLYLRIRSSRIIAGTVSYESNYKLRTLLSSTNTKSAFPFDKFEYRISYQHDNGTEYAIHSPTDDTQQWFDGTNLVNEIDTNTNNKFAINVDDYCLYHDDIKKYAFNWHDCTYNPSQKIEKRSAASKRENSHRVFFSFDRGQQVETATCTYNNIILSVKNVDQNTHNADESIAQIPIYCANERQDQLPQTELTDTLTSLLDIFPFQLPSVERYLWKFQILFDKPMTQMWPIDNITTNTLLLPVTYDYKKQSFLLYVLIHIHVQHKDTDKLP